MSLVITNVLREKDGLHFHLDSPAFVRIVTLVKSFSSLMVLNQLKVLPKSRQSQPKRIGLERNNNLAMATSCGAVPYWVTPAQP